ncbi:hypothetical protein CHUAL_010817 [Chamberlinius hualienensis]
MSSAIMAARWSTESVSTEFRDLQANTLAVDMSGKLALLAGRKVLAFVELDRPSYLVKRHLRQSKWEVSTAEWNPSSLNRHMFAIACNQRAELWTCEEDDFTNQSVLKYHTRAISDLQWSLYDAYRLATCSVDKFVYIWDIRDSKKPAISLCAIAGAGQVKWNKFKDHILATSHDGDVRIWDDRKGSAPLLYIAAHLSKIHGLDWSSIDGQEYRLVTAGQDNMVKFWDVNDPCRPVKVLSTLSPVWRARYTPFGEGLITVVVPQLRRGDHSLLLWNTNSLVSPVHTFMGHNDVVLEFQWRELTEAKEFQLVTWSRDQNLRIWKIDQQLQKLCSHDVDRYTNMEKLSDSELDSMELGVGNAGQSSVTSSQEKELDSSSSTQDPSTPIIINTISSSICDEKSELAQSESEKTDQLESRDVRSDLSLSQPDTLLQEFKLLNRDIPNLRVDEPDPVGRSCTFSIASGKYKVRFKLLFPNNYPYNSAPEMIFSPGSNISTIIKDELQKTQKMTCQTHVRNNLTCLEPLLRNLVATLDNFAAADQKETLEIGSPYKFDSTPSTFLSLKAYGSYQDSNVPFPRSCGASFGGANFLICFSRPSHMKGLRNGSELTPRALSAISAYAGNPMQLGHSSSQAYSFIYQPVAHSPTGEQSVSISSLYYIDRRHKVRGKLRKDDSQSKLFRMGFVAKYDVSKLLPISHELASTYSMKDADMKSMCQKNMAAAASVGRRDLVFVWSIVSVTVNSELTPHADPNLGMPWAHHPFGRELFQSLIKHYLLLGDIQTVVMLCCTLSSSLLPQTIKRPSPALDSSITVSQPTSKWWLKPGGSPYHTIHHGDTSLDAHASLGSLLRHNRSNSWSDCLDEYDRHSTSPFFESKEVEKDRHEQNSRLLDPRLAIQYDEFKRCYAEILYRWNLLETRTAILKHITTLPDTHKRSEFMVDCYYCQSRSQGVVCDNCKKYCLQCAICRLAIKGSFNFCVTCGHGGHTTHMMQWFQVHKVCPSGCGCTCLVENGPNETLT